MATHILLLCHSLQLSDEAWKDTIYMLHICTPMLNGINNQRRQISLSTCTVWASCFISAYSDLKVYQLYFSKEHILSCLFLTVVKFMRQKDCNQHAEWSLFGLVLFFYFLGSDYPDNLWRYLDPIYTGLVTMVQVLYLMEICCHSWVFIILYDEIKMLIFQLFLQIFKICFQKSNSSIYMYYL